MQKRTKKRQKDVSSQHGTRLQSEVKLLGQLSLLRVIFVGRDAADDDAWLTFTQNEKTKKAN